jgi:hypothetical protein
MNCTHAILFEYCIDLNPSLHISKFFINLKISVKLDLFVEFFLILII